ncbi:protein NEDD1-like [Agrilus planipennis]|uniref:Protein NEDD1-like n=1 Tax=Agrilus planipennis TaxID=224129 RepID=A0A1W4XEW6_AGRPL|nr:protein NEDD1-like [Agrilus planipennis]
MFVSAGTDLKFYSCPVDETEFHYLPQSTSKITSLSWCRDNSYLVFLSQQAQPEIISLKSSQNIKKVHTITALKDVSSVVFQKTTKKSIGIGTSNGQIALYDTKNKAISKLYPSINSRITCVDFDQKDETMAVAGANGTINILQLAASKFLTFYKTTDNSAANIVKYHPMSKNILATATDGGGICIWDVSASQKLFSAQMHTKPVGGLALGRQNDLFISAGFDRKFCVHDLNIKECVFRGNLRQPLSAIDISTRDDYIVLGTDEGMIYIYDFRYLLQPLSNWKAHNVAVNKIAFANEGKAECDSNKPRSSKAAVANKSRKENSENEKTSATVVAYNNQNNDKKNTNNSNNNTEPSNVNLLVNDMKLLIKNKTKYINSQMKKQFDVYRKILLDEFKSLDKQIDNKWDAFVFPSLSCDPVQRKIEEKCATVCKNNLIDSPNNIADNFENSVENQRT